MNPQFDYWTKITTGHHPLVSSFIVAPYMEGSLHCTAERERLGLIDRKTLKEEMSGKIKDYKLPDRDFFGQTNKDYVRAVLAELLRQTPESTFVLVTFKGLDPEKPRFNVCFNSGGTTVGELLACGDMKYVLDCFTEGQQNSAEFTHLEQMEITLVEVCAVVTRTTYERTRISY